MTGKQDPATVVETAMVAIRRRQTRRALARQAGESGAHTLVLDAVEQAQQGGPPATVTAVAGALAVDQPRASRLVAAAVRAGLVRRHADQSDGRRALLVLTDEGQAHLDQVHRLRRGVFASAMAGWTPAERAQFAELLTRFVAALDDRDAQH